MGRENIIVGKLGERIALGFLKRSGYRILETNFRTPFGELDVVARRGGHIVFVEVKTRASSSLGPPCLSVTRSKQRHIIRSALVYLKRRNLVDSNWRIDVVSVTMDHDHEVEKIELIENYVKQYLDKFK